MGSDRSVLGSRGEGATSPPRRRTSRASLSQLSLLEPAASRSRPDLDPTPPLARHPAAPRVLDKVRRARTFFPELDGVSIRVGITRAAAGFASRDDFWVWMNPSGLTLHTVAHELTHLVQNLGTIPKGEKSADLFALARHRTLVDEIPCYLKTPRSMASAWPQDRETIELLLHRTAREAVQYRDSGGRTYLRWFEEELRRRWKAHRTVAPSPGPQAIQLSL